MLDFDVKKLCYGCEACYNKCPKNAITMVEDNEGFSYPVIDENKCIECKLCDKVCQVLNKDNIKNNNINIDEKKCFAIYNKDENIRKSSSSGGLFTNLATNIIQKKGVVFGAVFNENMEVLHKSALTLEEISAMRGSKYSQSKIGTSYKEVEKFLKEGREVLFTATPCQVNGLYKFLRKDYDNLYTCDLICHGVPSPLVFKKYIKSLEMQNSKVNSYSFRDKTIGWKEFATKINWKDGKEHIESFNKNTYMKGFLNDLYLRNSCYHCKCKTKDILSDITIGDFWGIEKLYPQYDDNKGLCAVIVNTSKGINFLNEVTKDIFKEEVSFNDILLENSPLIHSVKYNKKREQFFKDFNNMDLISNIEEKLKISMAIKIKRKIGRTLRKFGIRK